MFVNREDAAMQLARRLRPLGLQSPLVLAVPRGGVVLGDVLARELHGDLDIVLARKLRAPYQRELAIGAIGEDGAVYLDPLTRHAEGVTEAYIEAERSRQVGEIERRREVVRRVAPALEVTGRAVILTDDGIATGSTLMAALHVLEAKQAREIVLAVPVAPPDALARFRPRCRQVVCLLEPAYLGAISQFYRDFQQVEDEEVVRIMQASRARPAAARPGDGKGKRP